MVKGEHLRPLLGFVVVCCTAALILGSGMTTPSALRQIVAQQRVLPAPTISDTLLGMTLDRLTGRASGQDATDDAADTAAAERQSSLLVASFPRVAQARATVAQPARIRHHHGAQHAQKKPSKPSAAAVTQPATPPKPVAPPPTPAPPTAAGGHAAGWVAGGPATHTIHGLVGGKHHGVGPVERSGGDEPGRGHHHGWRSSPAAHPAGFAAVPAAKPDAPERSHSSDRGSRHVRHEWHHGSTSAPQTRAPAHHVRSQDSGPRGSVHGSGHSSFSGGGHSRGHGWGHGTSHGWGHGTNHGGGHGTSHGGGHGPGDRAPGRHR